MLRLRVSDESEVADPLFLLVSADSVAAFACNGSKFAGVLKQLFAAEQCDDALMLLVLLLLLAFLPVLFVSPSSSVISSTIATSFFFGEQRRECFG